MGNLFHSKFSQRARGAAIIICKSVQFEPVTTISDSNGHFVIVTGKLYNTSVILAYYCIFVPVYLMTVIIIVL